MIFKEMKDTDLVRVLELEQACFKQPWLEKDCLYELNENPFSHGWILEDGDTIFNCTTWYLNKILQEITTCSFLIHQITISI